MGVRVEQTAQGPEGAREPYEVERGEDFVVREGALVVLDAPDGDQVAVFASGTWVHAEVID